MQNISQIWKTIQSPKFRPEQGQQLIDEVLHAALHSQQPALVSFGTSGWRGEIGTEFTLRNVQVVGDALIRLYQEADAPLWEALGISSFAELQKRGVVIGHDNRMLGRRFCEVVADCFSRENIKVYFAGEATTPEFSAAVEMLGAACAVNMTPSHNPSNYAGIKFNPADGGPAGPEITELITNYANQAMSTHVWRAPSSPKWEELDILAVYKKFLVRQGTIRFDLIRSLVDGGQLFLLTDHVHGATRNRPKFLLGNPACLHTLRTEDDPLFGGIAPEPSSRNLERVRSLVDASRANYRLGVIFDPDGDRIRFYDGICEIDMNAFGAIALHYMVTCRKLKGVVAKSVATSNFVNIIAARLGVKVAETPVGFKNFRPWMKRGAKVPALIAFEESDGISGYNNTIEKDAQFGLLLALEIIAVTGKNLGEYLNDLYKEYGRLYPERSAFTVEKAMVGAPLLAQVRAVGDKLHPGSVVQLQGAKPKVVCEVLTIDGTKVIFSDDSWLLIRPSGTEPKVRIYTECRDPAEKDALFAAAKELFVQAALTSSQG